MSEAFMNTKEVAEYLGIHEKQVYVLIKAGRLPATRVTGKWIFPKKTVDEWIEIQVKTHLGEARKTRDEGALLAGGSNDPVLELLLASIYTSHPECRIFTATMGSSAGLNALGRGDIDIAWSHILDPVSGQYNTPQTLAPHLQGMQAVVVHLFNRDLALLTAPDNPMQIDKFEDVMAKMPRIVNRQAGTGTRILLDHRLEQAGIAQDSIPGYDYEVFTHMEVGLAVLSGRADAGIASSSIARILGLHAIPLVTESFDMVLAQSTFFLKAVQSFIDVLQTAAFQNNVLYLGGYDFRNTGRVVQTAC